MNTKDIVYISLFASLTAVMGVFPPIHIPIINIPITAQSLGPMMAGSILGWKKGSISLLLFIVLISMGLPVLSGGRGGIHLLLGPSGGFILAWPIVALLIGIFSEIFFKNINFIKFFLIISFGGIVVNYLIGGVWLYFMSNIQLKKLLTLCLVFVPGDIVKVLIASSVAVIIKKTHPIISPDFHRF